MSQSGGGVPTIPVSSNPIQMQNPVSGAGGTLPSVSQAGLPINTAPNPIQVQGTPGFSSASPLAGADPLNTSLPSQGPTPSFMAQLSSALNPSGGANQNPFAAAMARMAPQGGAAPPAGVSPPGGGAANNAIAQMQAAQRQTVAAPTLGQGQGSAGTAQQVGQMMQILKLFAGA